MGKLIDLKRAHMPFGANQEQRVSITVHVEMRSYDGKKTLLVHDMGGRETNTLALRGVKPERWGFVTGKTHVGEIPYIAGHREFREESNILKEQTPFMIARLPAYTTKHESEDKASVHIELLFSGKLQRDEELPEETFPIRDPLGHITEGYWISIFEELPTIDEANDYCQRFDYAKKSGIPIEHIEKSPWYAVNGRRVLPISPHHLKLFFRYGLSNTPESLDTEIETLTRIAEETGFTLPRISEIPQ